MRQDNVASFQRAAAKRRLRTAIQEAIQPHLEPGEHVRRAFLAQSSPQTFVPAIRVAALFRAVKLVAIAATDRHVYVLGRRGSSSRPKLDGVALKYVRRPSAPIAFEEGTIRIGPDLFWATPPAGPADARDLVAFVEGDGRLHRLAAAQNQPV